VHTAAERAEVELGVQGMRRLAAGPLVDPVQGQLSCNSTVDPSTGSTAGRSDHSCWPAESWWARSNWAERSALRSVLLNVRDSGQARQPLGLAPRGVDDEHAEMAEDGARVEPLSGGEVSASRLVRSTVRRLFTTPWWTRPTDCSSRTTRKLARDSSQAGLCRLLTRQREGQEHSGSEQELFHEGFSSEGHQPPPSFC